MTDSPRSFTRILVPIDFAAADEAQIEAGHAIQVGDQQIEYAPASRAALELATNLARLSGGTVYLFHVTPQLTHNSLYSGGAASLALSGDVIGEVHRQACETGVAALRVLAEGSCEGVEYECIARPGVALYAILEEAEAMDADMIVLAASGRSRVARFFVGSTADRIIRQANCPVVVIPAQTE